MLEGMYAFPGMAADGDYRKTGAVIRYGWCLYGNTIISGLLGKYNRPAKDHP